MGNHLTVRRVVPAGILVVVAILLAACNSGPSTATTTTVKSTTTTSTPRHVGFGTGPNPCTLVTAADVQATFRMHMTKVTETKSTCAYANRSSTDTISISTAKSTRGGAVAAVNSAAATAKAHVFHVRGIGQAAIAYVTTTKTRATANCVFAKAGVIAFIVVGSPSERSILHDVEQLATRAASRV